MGQIKSVVVFCGASDGYMETFVKEAYRMGQILAENNITLIYGAGGQGVMKAVAEGALSENGYVIGTTIQSLFGAERPDLSANISKMEIFQTMYERKLSMTKQADAVLVLPGGLGTMDELFELVVLRQLGISHQPIIVLNTEGYYNTLRQWLFEMTGMGFVKPHQLKIIQFVNTVDEVIPAMHQQQKLLAASSEQKDKNA